MEVVAKKRGRPAGSTNVAKAPATPAAKAPAKPVAAKKMVVKKYPTTKENLPIPAVVTGVRQLREKATIAALVYTGNNIGEVIEFTQQEVKVGRDLMLIAGKDLKIKPGNWVINNGAAFIVMEAKVIAELFDDITSK